MDFVLVFPSPANCDASKLLNSGFGGAYGDGDDAATELTQGTKVKLEYMVRVRRGAGELPCSLFVKRNLGLLRFR